MATTTTTTTTTKQSAIETTINGTVLTLMFSNGEQLECDVSAFNPTIALAATLHGAKQKLCDAGAISRDPETGRTATIETKYNAVKEVFDRITKADGTWNKIREAGTGSGGLLLSALIRMYGGRKTKEQLVEFLAKLTETEKSALRKSPKIATIIEEIKAERAQNDDDDGIDTDSILAELE